MKFSTLVAFSERGDENLLPKRDTQMFFPKLKMTTTVLF